MPSFLRDNDSSFLPSSSQKYTDHVTNMQFLRKLVNHEECDEQFAWKLSLRIGDKSLIIYHYSID